MVPPNADPLVRKMMTIASVGSEMCGPIILGLALDYWLNWMPILTVLGAVLGLVLGVYRLVRLNRPTQP